MDARTVGLLVAVVGVAIVIVGLLIATGILNWFGRLPGDINWDRGNVRVFVPITSIAHRLGGAEPAPVPVAPLALISRKAAVAA